MISTRTQVFIPQLRKYRTVYKKGNEKYIIIDGEYVEMTEFKRKMKEQFGMNISYEQSLFFNTRWFCS